MSQVTTEQITGCRHHVRIVGYEIRSFRSRAEALRFARAEAKNCDPPWQVREERGEIVVSPPHED